MNQKIIDLRELAEIKKWFKKKCCKSCFWEIDRYCINRLERSWKGHLDILSGKFNKEYDHGMMAAIEGLNWAYFVAKSIRTEKDYLQYVKKTIKFLKNYKFKFHCCQQIQNIFKCTCRKKP